ncbi:MAG: DUF4136 domain-containing protein [Cyclobacteriaceae bacterium]
MKYLIPILLLIGTSCASYYNRIIESDYSYAGKFDRYSSFDFLINESDGIDQHQSDLVEKYIGQRLNALGYHQTSSKPNLIIMYKFFKDDFNMKGFSQPNFASYIQDKHGRKFIKEPKESNDPEVVDLVDYFTVTKNDTFLSNEEEQEYEELKCPMIEGSLLITFFDRRAKRSIWQGYASGVSSRITEDRFIRHTVGKILDEYTVLATGFQVPN